MTSAARRVAPVVLALALVATTATGCQRVTAGSRCTRTGSLAVDRTWVLRCDGGRWRRAVTVLDERRLQPFRDLLGSVPTDLPLTVRGTTVTRVADGVHQRSWTLDSLDRSAPTVCDDVTDALVAFGAERIGDCAPDAAARRGWTIPFETGPTVGRVTAARPTVTGRRTAVRLTVTIAGCGPGRGAARFATLATILPSCRRPAPAPGAVTDPTPAQTLSAATSALGRPARSDVPFGGRAGCPGPESDESCGGSTTFDVYRAAGTVRRGTVIWLHGGGWVAGDKVDEAGRDLLADLRGRGWSVVSANYGLLGPAGPVAPEPVREATALVAAVRSRAVELGIDVRRIVLGGFSAGGTLAAMVATMSSGPLPPPPIRGAVRTARVDGWFSVAGALDPRAGRSTADIFTTYLDGDRNSIRAALVSPVALLDRTDPPGYAVHGDGDVIAEVGNLSSLELRVRRTGAHVLTDRVDRYADGRRVPGPARGHVAFGGMNVHAFRQWIERVPAR